MPTDVRGSAGLGTSRAGGKGGGEGREGENSSLPVIQPSLTGIFQPFITQTDVDLNLVSSKDMK